VLSALGCGVEVHHLSGSVHTSIGAPGANQHYRMRCDF
jgi:hypothetical protein